MTSASFRCWQVCVCVCVWREGGGIERSCIGFVCMLSAELGEGMDGLWVRPLYIWFSTLQL